MQVVWIGLSLLAVVLVAAALVYRKKDPQEVTKSMYLEKKSERPALTGKKVLLIGNSYGDDTVRYVPYIAKNLGVKNFVVANVFLDGCTLEGHVENYEKNAPAYIYRKADENGWVFRDKSTLSYALGDEDWDLVIFQQASGETADYSTYQPHLNKLLGIVRSRLTDVRFGFDMTWAYPVYSRDKRFAYYDNDQMKMYEAIAKVMTEHIEPGFTFEFVVPVGTAVQNARALCGDQLCRDDIHLSVKGRYLAGVTFVKEIFGVSLGALSYAPEGVEREDIDLFVKAVEAAYAEPYKATGGKKAE